METGTLAAVLAMISSAVGWWASRRLPHAPNLERLRRLARIVLAGSVATVTTSMAYVASVGLSGGASTGPAGTGRALLLAAPVLVVWIATIPRTWVLIRGRSSSDPLSWIGPALRLKVSGSVFAVPLGVSLVAALLVLLTPTAVVELPYGAGLIGLGLTLAAATATIDAAHRRQRSRALRAAQEPLLAGASR